MEEAERTTARVLAVVCQLWCWLGPFAVVPVVVRFTAARRSPLLHQVTGEVLNLQIAALVPGVVSGAAGVAGWNLAALVLWACFMVVALYGYVVGVIGAVRSWWGERWRYPLNLSVVARG